MLNYSMLVSSRIARHMNKLNDSAFLLIVARLVDTAAFEDANGEELSLSVKAVVNEVISYGLYSASPEGVDTLTASVVSDVLSHLQSITA